MIIRQLGLAIGVLTSNRKGFATNFGGVHVGRHCWAPLLESRHAGVLLGAIAGSHCSMPFLGAIAGAPLPECHCWVPPYRGAAGCHCWVPLVHCWGAIGGVPLLGAIAGCSTNFPTLGAIARCHCWMPLGESNCWVPLREKIGQSDTPFSSASFSTLITQIGLCYLGSMLVYIILWTSSAIIYGKCSPPDLNHPRVSRASVETDTKNSGKPAPSQKKNVETTRLPPLTATLLPRTSRRKITRRRRQKCREKKTTHAKTPNASGGRRSALPPNPPPAFFLFKVASSHCHIASKNITKKNHKKKKKTKMTKENNTCKDTQCIWGGGAAPSPPTPLQPFSSLRLPPLTATLLPRTSRRKNTRRRRQKCREKKTTHAKTPNASGGEAQRPPPQPPSSLLFV